jgi:Xaa-Pro aminopeptidase
MEILASRLDSLRISLSEFNIDACIIPCTDPHLGEYVPDHWRIIEWLTGFKGSNAIVVITQTFAGLWTDSRYFIQAQNQLQDSGFELMKPGVGGKNDPAGWLAENLAEESKVALDGRTISTDRLRKIKKALESKIVSFNLEYDLISDLWIDRPPMPSGIAFDHPLKFCGKERAEKISDLRLEMAERGIDYHLLTDLDDIMWLLNIRGSDVKYSPLLTSYAIVDREQILFFANEAKIPFRMAMEFDKLGIVILPYEEAAGMLSTLPIDATILFNPSTTSAALYNSIPSGMTKREGLSITSGMKAIKNKTEIENIERVMLKDGIALTKFFYWFEQNRDSELISELSIGEKLSELRLEQEHYLGPSFATIAAWNEHGALPHYSATPESNYTIGISGTLLIDSGGQYLDGTTDITRTIAVGLPTSKQVRDFTLVLKGNLNLAAAKFPAGTKGYQLDILARKVLWENGLNYGHGTGHGVGFCLNVHEGPQSISPALNPGSNGVLIPGMLTSDEPAIYREGEYGIRIENLLLCYEDEQTEFGSFLKFDTVSLCYIDNNLIDRSLLVDKEVELLNIYHSEVYRKLSPYLTSEEQVWLKEKTAEI